jgi:hypothetical protein
MMLRREGMKLIRQRHLKAKDAVCTVALIESSVEEAAGRGSVLKSPNGQLMGEIRVSEIRD